MSNVVIDNTPFDHHATGVDGSMPNGQRKVDQSDRKLDLVVSAEIIRQDTRSERLGVPRDALD